MKIRIFCYLLFLFLGIYFAKFFPLLKIFFPVDHVEAVMFTINQKVTGSENVIYTLFTKELAASILDFILITFLALSISFFLKKKTSLKKSSFIFTKTIFTFSATSLAIAIVTFFISFPVAKYIQTWYNYIKTPAHSELYIKEYIKPDSISFPEQKKNLILIFLESMETNFQDSAHGGNLSINRIPEITQYMLQNDNFKSGGLSVFGTNWTMAAVVSKTCGIPLNYPPGIYHSTDKIKNFLPHAICLTDVLKKNSYNILFAQGSDKEFASMGAFAQTHGNIPIHDYQYYQQKYSLNQEKKENWGISDRKIYDYSKEDIKKLNSKQPFAIIITTLDTHMPYGYMDPKCHYPEGKGAKELYPYILECSSKLLDDFIQWAKSQPWYRNTVIAVMGDHETYVPPEAVGFKDTTITHRWISFFINSSVQTDNFQREYTSFDMYPTILESIGATVPNHALGLGRSLYSNKATLLEKYGADSLNKLLGGRSIEYDYFLYTK